MTYCESCGTKIKPESNFCESCGKGFKKIEAHRKGIKERPTFLKVLLGLCLVSWVIEFSILISISSGSSIYNSFPSFFLPYLIISSVLFLICLYGLYIWKMWGFYGFIILQILGFVISITTIGVMALFSAIGSGVFILLLYFAMKPVWEDFE